jgi:WhiB family transcriptional regulator, redox-sensing transcriptional regulator
MTITAGPSQPAPLSHQKPNQQARSGRPASPMEVTSLQFTAMLEPTHDDPTKPAYSATLPCRRYDAELWFAETPADVELAKSLCLDCPVRQACLAGALDRREPWGVWGGQLLVQGAVVARKRPRGRPRKCEVAA